MVTQNLAETLKSIEAQLNQAIMETGAQLAQAPQNPKVQPLQGSAFVTSVKSVLCANNWSAFFHDWVAQYEFVNTLLRARRFSDLKKLLSGNVVDGNRLAPEVILRVKHIVGELADCR